MSSDELKTVLDVMKCESDFETSDSDFETSGSDSDMSLMDDSDKNYLEEIVPSYTEEKFLRHFRISKTLFEHLSEKFEQSEAYTVLRPKKRLSGRSHLAVFLWFAGHEACRYRDLADRFDLTLSTVSHMMDRTTMFISNMSPDIIKWPTEDQKKNTSEFFKNKSGFPGTIGCINCTHIEIDPPKHGKDDYIDIKGDYTLIMQAICDEKKKIIDIFIGYPGSSRNSWIFQNSKIYQELATACGEYHLLGDSTYPCSENLVTPYRDNGQLTRKETLFNVKLSSSYYAIEDTFGKLKQRFRQLNYCTVSGIKELCHFIRACCVLHNMSNVEDIKFLIRHRKISKRGAAQRDAICKEMEKNLQTFLNQDGC